MSNLVVHHRNNLMNIEECKFSDIWYTGSTPFPSEVHLRFFHCGLSTEIIDWVWHTDD